MAKEKYDYEFQALGAGIKLEREQHFALMVIVSTKNETVAVAMSGANLAKLSETIQQTLADNPEIRQWMSHRMN